jgi:hypothetical protein
LLEHRQQHTPDQAVQTVVVGRITRGSCQQRIEARRAVGGRCRANYSGT